MKACIEQVFDGSIATTPVTAYDPNLVNLGPMMGQFNLGSGQNDKFVGPRPVGIARLVEAGGLRAGAGVHPIKFGNDTWWLFVLDNATAGATRVVHRWDYTPSTNTLAYIGGITLTLPTATNHTMRGMRVIVEDYTTGTVAVSGTAVTGTGTTWNASRQSVGCRIGFGSTDPALITTWYQISAVGSDTSITLTATAGTITAGTPYVIQDMIIATATTNATATNGGLFVIKGLRPEIFTVSPTAIPAAVSTDRIRACYWLKDAGTITNTAAGGVALGNRISWTEQYVYVVDGAATTLKIFKYNIRAALTPATGAFTLTGSDLVITGNQTVTGNISQLNNGRVGTLNHGPGSGVECLYLLTTTRIVRVPLANIVGASTTFVADSMAEVPPGGTSTQAVAGTFTAFDIISSLDRLVITTTTAAGSNYLTQYRTDGGQFDRRFGATTLQLDSASASTDQPPHPHTTSVTMAVWVEEGIAYFTTISTTGTLNHTYVYPLGADWDYADVANNRVITPKISLGATASKLYRVLVNATNVLGGSSLGIVPDAWRLKYRTSGIDDNSGAWTLVAANGDISGVGVGTDIQFCFEFRVLGPITIPARILSLALVYETADDLPSQYRWNFADFDSGTGTVAWVQATAFGSSPGVHTIDIYRSDTNALVLTQASSGSTNGDFQYWNGSSWTNGLGTDTVGLRRRFVPTASLPSGIELYAKITVA